MDQADVKNIQPEKYFVQKITEKDLPQKWNYVILSEKSDSENGQFFIRCNVFNLKECHDWVQAFSEKSFTQWNNRSSKPTPSAKLTCQKTYVCHRSSYNKTTSCKQTPKNTHCEARIKISVKIITPHTRRNDPHLKNGLPGIIHMTTRHNHPIDSVSALKYLTPSRDLQETFYEYFEMGMSSLTACRHHENRLLIEGAKGANILKNPRFNPSKRTAQHWFDLWKKAYVFQKDRPKIEKEKDDVNNDVLVTEVYISDDDDDQDTTFINEPEINDSGDCDDSYQPACEIPEIIASYVVQPTTNQNTTGYVLQPTTTRNAIDDVQPPCKIPKITASYALQPTTTQNAINNIQPPCEIPKITASYVLRPTTTRNAIPNVPQPTTNKNTVDMDGEIVLPAQQGSVIKNVITMIEKLHEKYGSSDLAKQATSRFAARLKEIKSGDDWVNFLHSAAESSPPTDNSKIRTQPAVIPKPNPTMRRPVFIRR